MSKIFELNKKVSEYINSSEFQGLEDKIFKYLEYSYTETNKNYVLRQLVVDIHNVELSLNELINFYKENITNISIYCEKFTEVTDLDLEEGSVRVNENFHSYSLSRAFDLMLYLQNPQILIDYLPSKEDRLDPERYFYYIKSAVELSEEMGCKFNL